MWDIVDLSILGSVLVKVLLIVFRFVAAEDKLKRFTVAEGMCEFLCSDSWQRRTDSLYLLFLTAYALF